MKYSIYILVNPDTDHPFYVGQSTCPDQRRYSHQRDARDVIENNIKGTQHTPSLFRYFIENKIIPRLEIVDYVETENKKEADSLENYWIWQFRSWGFDIVNSRFFIKNPTIIIQ